MRGKENSNRLKMPRIEKYMALNESGLIRLSHTEPKKKELIAAGEFLKERGFLFVDLFYYLETENTKSTFYRYVSDNVSVYDENDKCVFKNITPERYRKEENRVGSYGFLTVFDLKDEKLTSIKLNYLSIGSFSSFKNSTERGKEADFQIESTNFESVKFGKTIRDIFYFDVFNHIEAPEVLPEKFNEILQNWDNWQDEYFNRISANKKQSVKEDSDDSKISDLKDSGESPKDDLPF